MRFGPTRALALGATLILSLAALAVSRGDEEEVQIADCPAAVQKTLKEESRGGAIESVSKETEGGKTSYWAEALIGGRLYEIGVDADGMLSEFQLKADDHEIGLADCPDDVQSTFRREAGGKKIRDVRREVRLGATVYVTTVAFGNKSYDIKVAEDGTLTEKVLVIEENGLPLAECPDEVQKVLKLEAKGGTVGEVTRSEGLRKRVYITDIDANGKRYALEVAEDGALLSKTRLND